jgi:hypothetical protein
MAWKTGANACHEVQDALNFEFQTIMIEVRSNRPSGCYSWSIDLMSDDRSPRVMEEAEHQPEPLENSIELTELCSLAHQKIEEALAEFSEIVIDDLSIASNFLEEQDAPGLARSLLKIREAIEEVVYRLEGSEANLEEALETLRVHSLEKSHKPGVRRVTSAAIYSKHLELRNRGSLTTNLDHTVGEVLDSMHAYLRKDNLIDGYFTVRNANEGDRSREIRACKWRFRGQTRGISCYVTTSSFGKHHFIFIKVLPGSTMEILGQNGCELAMGKTYRGLEHAYKIAARCAQLLDA